MFIRSFNDVDVYAKKIYSWIICEKGKEYVEFVQELSKDKIEDTLNIVIADIHDYFDLHTDKQYEYNEYDKYKVEKIKIREEIDEKIYILDRAFFRYVIERHKPEKHNIMYLIKSILLSIKDVNSNILYILMYNKNKDANIHIKYITLKYTTANIKVTRNVMSKLGIKVDKSVTSYEFLKSYEKFVENQIEKFETEVITKEEIKLTQKDLLVYFYLKSFSKKYVDIKIEEIARDCNISEATVSRAIKKLEKKGRIKIQKIRNKNIYEIIDYEEQPSKSEKQKEHSKTNISTKVKDIELQTSELDYKRYKKNEKLDANTRYKLYMYRQKYAEELQNTKLSRMTKDDLLFFLVNTEHLVENGSVTPQQILKIIRYADANPAIRNPIGWLISRFMIARGRFYFLLNNRKLKSKQSEKMESSCENSHEKSTDNIKQKKADRNKKDIYINGDLAYFIQKYNIPENEILSYLSKFEGLHGDVSYIVERYVANKIWKNLSKEERQKLIIYAQREIKRFAVPPKSKEEFEQEVKSIIFAKIMSDYLTLSIEDRIKLRIANQSHDTS
ncbi:helix-turn-helix transcriptional regulator [Persephonella sp.]